MCIHVAYVCVCVCVCVMDGNCVFAWLSVIVILCDILIVDNLHVVHLLQVNNHCPKCYQLT